MGWQVYLAGEIHSEWRKEITGQSEALGLPVTYCSPITNHQLSDSIGQSILGREDKEYWNDYKSVRLNQARNKVLMEKSEIVVVRFGEKYKQWNSAFDAGQAVAQGKSLISWHDVALNHALKEIDAASAAVANDLQQVVKAIGFICTGKEI